MQLTQEQEAAEGVAGILVHDEMVEAYSADRHGLQINREACSFRLRSYDEAAIFEKALEPADINEAPEHRETIF
jgi:hypothetical protein